MEGDVCWGEILVVGTGVAAIDFDFYFSVRRVLSLVVPSAPHPACSLGWPIVLLPPQSQLPST